MIDIECLRKVPEEDRAVLVKRGCVYFVATFANVTVKGEFVCFWIINHITDRCYINIFGSDRWRYLEIDNVREFP